MLIEFRVSNHRSLRDEVALTMEAGRVGDDADPRPRMVSGHNEPLLTVAALYGANASGKSNLLSALGFMQEAVIHSHRTWAPDGGVPRDAFAWGEEGTDRTTFEATFLAGGSKYQYGFVCDDRRILEEWLWAWPNGHKQVWFEREGDIFKRGHKLSGDVQPIEDATGANALFLSTAAQLRHPQLWVPYTWFADIRAIRVGAASHPIDQERDLAWLWAGLERTSPPRRDPSQPPLADDEDPRFSAFLELLLGSDLGLRGVRLDDLPPSALHPAVERRFGGRPRRVSLNHVSDRPEAWLPLEQESAGTRALFRSGPLIVHALARGGLLLVDELEASLHPLLALKIVDRFNNPRTNPNNAQMIFATHDTHLLGHTLGDSALRRDQVWMTEKDAAGVTHLYPLTDFKPRKAENLERGYLQGRYGAVPILGELVRPQE